MRSLFLCVYTMVYCAYMFLRDKLSTIYSLAPYIVFCLIAIAAFIGTYLYFLTSPCVVLERTWCGKGVPVYYQDKLIGIGFTLPSGTKLYAPFDGVWSYTGRASFGKGQTAKAGGVEILTGDQAKDTNFSFVGEINTVVSSNTSVRRRTLIGRASGTPIEALGSYTLILSPSSFDTTLQYFVPDAGLIKKFFRNVDL